LKCNCQVKCFKHQLRCECQAKCFNQLISSCVAECFWCWLKCNNSIRYSC
jgi:hypothetical protein